VLADVLEQNDRKVTLVWREEDKTWIDERTGTQSTLTGKSSTKVENPLQREEMCGTTDLRNFPFKWLDKDNKEKFQRKSLKQDMNSSSLSFTTKVDMTIGCATSSVLNTWTKKRNQRQTQTSLLNLDTHGVSRQRRQGTPTHRDYHSHL
jgi:hypothetical protein